VTRKVNHGANIVLIAFNRIETQMCFLNHQGTVFICLTRETVSWRLGG